MSKDNDLNYLVSVYVEAGSSASSNSKSHSAFMGNHIDSVSFFVDAKSFVTLLFPLFNSTNSYYSLTLGRVYRML